MSTILITGANKGIGRGFVEKYLERPGTTIVAAVRDPSASDSKSLYDLPKAQRSKVIVVKIESASETDALEAVKSLSSHGIFALDVVIANAGIFPLEDFVRVKEINTSHLMEHFNVNTAGPVRLYQATLPLMEKAANPKFMVVSSIVGSISSLDFLHGFPVTSYGASKAAINHLTRHMHFENEKLIAFAMHPGGVDTERGSAAGAHLGMTQPTTVKDSINGMVEQLDAATRDETGGKFLSFDRSPMSW